jgi:hypothetical protein
MSNKVGVYPSAQEDLLTFADKIECTDYTIN